MKIDHQAYSVGEGLILQVTLSLSLRASYDIGVTVHDIDRNASELHIVQCKYIHNVVNVKASSYIHCYTYMNVHVCTYMYDYLPVIKFNPDSRYMYVHGNLMSVPPRY